MGIQIRYDKYKLTFPKRGYISDENFDINCGG